MARGKKKLLVIFSSTTYQQKIFIHGRTPLTLEVPMWSILHMRVRPLVAALAPRTGKIIHRDHKRGENCLHFLFRLCQSSKIVLVS